MTWPRRLLAIQGGGWVLHIDGSPVDLASRDLAGAGGADDWCAIDGLVHQTAFDEVPRGGRALLLLARSAAVSLVFVGTPRLRVRSVRFGLTQSQSVGLKRHFSKHMRG